MVSMSNIGAYAAGGLSALGSLGCLFKTAETVTKAIKGDGQPTSFQRLLNKTFGEAETKASETGRQALEALAWGAAGLLLAGVSWSCVDSEVNVPDFSSLLGGSEATCSSGVESYNPDDLAGSSLLKNVTAGIGEAFSTAADFAGLAVNKSLTTVSENPGASLGVGVGGAAAMGGAAGVRAAGGLGAAASAFKSAAESAAGAVAGKAMDAVGRAKQFVKRTPVAPQPDSAAGS